MYVLCISILTLNTVLSDWT